MLETDPKPSDSELHKYYQSDSYISHTDSKTSITDKVYQWVKRYMLRKKLNFINSFKTPKNILDIGCGTGDFLKICKENGWKINGIEPEEKALKRAKEKIKTNNSVYKDIKNVSQKKYDVITMWHVLEHIPNLKDYIFTLENLLTKNGVLIIAVPNFKSYDAKYYKEFWAAYDAPRHLWHFSKKSIQLFFNEANFKIVKTKPMIFDAFYISLMSEKYKSGKNNFLKAFWIGFISNVVSIWKKEPSSRIYVLKKRF